MRSPLSFVFTLVVLSVLLGMHLVSSYAVSGQSAVLEPFDLKGNQKNIQYKKIPVPQGVLHAVLIPHQSQYQVIPAVSDKLEDVESFSRRLQSSVVINGGYFDPSNTKTTSYITLGGKLAADPHENESLMGNASLRQYMERILNRTEFRVYSCGPSETIRYDITPHNDASRVGCFVKWSMGAGPNLLPKVASLEEGFIDYSNGRISRDPIGVNQQNARSGVGITPAGDVILAMLAQKPTSGEKTGVGLEEFSGMLKLLGSEKAMGLDGGSSSSMVINNKGIYGKRDSAGKPMKRKVKSVLLIQPVCSGRE